MHPRLTATLALALAALASIPTVAAASAREAMLITVDALAKEIADPDSSSCSTWGPPPGTSAAISQAPAW